MSGLKLIVGLGNPGAEHARTRHNAGFHFVEALAEKAGARWSVDAKLFGQTCKVDIAGQAVWLLKPATFMNLSGKSVAALARFYKIAPDEILVAHDELDLPAGEAKLKQGGGHAGHNGLRDIHAQLGSSDYWRLRLGIGHPGSKSEVVGWVLKKPPLDEQIGIEQAIDRAAKAFSQLAAGDMAAATQIIHTAKPPRPKPPRKPPPEAAEPPVVDAP